MDSDAMLGLFVKDFMTVPPSVDKAVDSLAQYLGANYPFLPANTVDLLISIGGQLVHHGVEAWWADPAASALSSTVLKQIAERPKARLNTVHPSTTRRSVSLHEIQLMIARRKGRYERCDGLEFDAARWIAPDENGCNWDIEPIPTRVDNRGSVPYDCYCVMESYFTDLRATLNVYDPESRPVRADVQPLGLSLDGLDRSDHVNQATPAARSLPDKAAQCRAAITRSRELIAATSAKRTSCWRLDSSSENAGAEVEVDRE